MPQVAILFVFSLLAVSTTQLESKHVHAIHHHTIADSVEIATEEASKRNMQAAQEPGIEVTSSQGSLPGCLSLAPRVFAIVKRFF